MIHSKFLARLLAVLSVMIVGILAFGVFAMIGSPAHASQIASGTSKPRSIHFHGNFSDIALATSNLKHWSSSFSSGGKTWKYSMVGTNPTKGSATTTVPVTIVPLLLKFSNGKSFDGTPQVSSTTSSPLFQNAPFKSGTTQYGDAIQRAEFWNSVSIKSPNYHVLVGSPTIAQTVTLTIPLADGKTVVDSSSGKTIGLININWFDPQIQTLLTSLNFTPKMLPIFLTHNVYLSQGAPTLGNCCIGGYHNAVTDTAGLQTYIWSTEADPGVEGGFGVDVSALSHEMLEWFNDPFTNNTVPNWISPIAPQYGCNNLLEVGDPLVGVVFTVSGFSSDHLQDIALFSWFARKAKPISMNGLYTYLGTFTGLSKTC
ncbi:MAG TPA: hypothetical protein VNW73_02565 [Ktedonobacteraceae bacterium]|nr:hypothetical protein [Ktedonobacteraceae bacterium]